MKLPRDISSAKLITALKTLDYIETRQRGSHIRLTKKYSDGEHHITIPNHDPIKIGTLNSILNDISTHFGITKQQLIEKLF